MSTTSRLVGAALAVGIAALVNASARPAETFTPQESVAARESAYRANNLGVAQLEQYDFPAAVESFRRALEQDPNLGIARLNLGIALFYAGQADAARPELEKARESVPDRPHADYVLGLIARAGNQTDDALAAFTRAATLDRTDPGIAINLGQLHLQQRQYPEALAAFRTAAEAEPYNATAAYGLATALIRSGAGAEGKTAMDRFETLRGSNYATTFSQNYLEQGRYAEAIASTGAEAALVDARIPEIGFVDATRDMLSGPTAGGVGAVTLVDLDRDGDLDLAAASGSSLRLYRNDKGHFADITTEAFAKPPAGPLTGIVAGDADNDGNADLLLLRAGGPAIYRQESARFVEAGPEAGLPRMQNAPRAAAWLDADHDGDLDLMIAGEPETVRLLRNNGDGKFSDTTSAAAIAASGALAAVVPTDFDNRRDIDLLLVPVKGAPALLRNMRDGTFRDVAGDVGFTLEGALAPPAVGDVNKDGYPDFFLGHRDRAGSFAMSDGSGRFTVTQAPPETTGASAAQFLDYDNDGLLDLVLAVPQGLRVLRNVGSKWMDVSTRAFRAPSGASQEAPSLASGDIDGDGDVDIVLGNSAGLTIWRNDGASRARSLAIRLTPRVSNRAAVGTKIEVRAGSLRQRLETYAATPAPAPADVHFGFGDRAGADVARVLWPSGILQAETPSGSGVLTGVVTVEELDRKPSSCPYLYTWNGDRFEFVTDFLGGGEMGYWVAPGVRNSPDPDEYVRIDGAKLKPRSGRFELRVTNELEEAVFLDRTQLVVLTHPAEVTVHPNEGLRSTRQGFRLFAIRNERPPEAVHDHHEHDVLERVRRVDRTYPDDFSLERIRGYAERHALTITLPSSTDPRALLLTGWTDYAFSGDNVAAHQRGLRMEPPVLEIEDEPGRWQPLIADVGFPVGRPQTIVVDLTGKVPAERTRVRLVTNMRIYWDQISIGDLDASARPHVTRLDPGAAELTWRGFSELSTPDGKEPYSFDYAKVTPQSPWKLLPGRYTREGDVRELVTATDDRFVVMRPGDELALTFAASPLPALPSGWTRTFLLYTAGFSKEMDLNSSSPDELAPLPYHGMPAYPYGSAAPPPARDDYVARYNTRIVKRAVPPIELSAGQR